MTEIEIHRTLVDQSGNTYDLLKCGHWAFIHAAKWATRPADAMGECKQCPA